MKHAVQRIHFVGIGGSGMSGIAEVMHEYLGFGGGPPMFRQDFTCPALLEDHGSHYAYGAVTRYGPTFQKVLLVSP